VIECTAMFRIKHAAASVASASAAARTQTGYVQGMSFLASILLLALGDDPFLCFLALANLLENPAERLSELFAMDAATTENYLDQFSAQLTASLPHLAKHFEEVGVKHAMYIFKWIFSVYSQALDLDTVFRVWDCFLWESFKTRGQIAAVHGRSNSTSTSGPRSAISSAISSARDALMSASSNPSAASLTQPGSGFPFLFRVALGILSMYSDSLRQCSFEECLDFLQHLPRKSATTATQDEALDIDQLFQHVKDVRMDEKIWNTAANTNLVAPAPARYITPVKSKSDTAATTGNAQSRPDYSGHGSPSPHQSSRD
jgi:hypothetical protein